MASAQDVFAASTEIHRSIAQTLQRCAALPGLDSARLDRISGYRDRSNELHKSASALFDAIGNDARGALDQAQQQLAAAQAELQEASADSARADAEQRRRQAEHTRAVAQLQQGGGNPQTNAQIQSLQGVLNQATQKHNSEQQERRNRITDLQQVIVPDCQRAHDRAQKDFNAKLPDLRIAPNQELDRLLLGLRSVLDEVGLFEREVQGNAGSLVTAAVKADFSSKISAFSGAANYHEKQATILLALLGIVAVASGVVIYILFLRPTTGSAVPRLVDAASGHVALDVIESILLVGVGRIATLALLGLIARHVARLHRANSEQLVIYRDRIAALGVAETIVGISPYDKKVDFLKTLADGYLTFEHNAFRERKPASQSRSGSNDASIAQLRGTIEAMKPAFEVVKTIADKAK